MESPVLGNDVPLESRPMARAKGIVLIVLGALLSSIAVVVMRVQSHTLLDSWLTAMKGLLLSIGLDLDVRVVSLCACATLLSGFLFLTRYSSKAVIVGWQAVRFLLHLAAVYAIVLSCTARLAGWTRASLLTLLDQPTSSSGFEFLFAHIFAFSFIPGLIGGIANAKFKHRVAQYVWLVPAIVLAYDFVTFPEPTRSVLDSAAPSFSRFSSAFHEYFGRGFLIAEYRNWADFWSIVRSNPDMMRGMTQLRVTAPFYAGVGYCLAASIVLRFQVLERLVERVKAWEQFRFERS